RPRPARPARRQGLDRAGPAGHRPARQAPGRLRRGRTVAWPARAESDRGPPGPGAARPGRGQTRRPGPSGPGRAAAGEHPRRRPAEPVVAFLGAPGRFDCGRQVSAYGGLVPRQYQSGEQDRRGRITRRGPALLRKLLVECAWVMLRYNSWARAVYERLSRGKARKKQAIVGLARKLLVRCWAMLRDGAPWRGGTPGEAAPA